MIVCPVCEHQQAQGFTCDVCGKDLGASLGDGSVVAGLELDIPKLPGLEQAAAEATGEVQVQRMAELEANIGAAGTPQVPTPLMPELERASADPTGNVPVQVMPELASDRAEFVGQKAAAPGAQIQCRYCGNVQAKGKLCDKCGMRLPRAGVTEAAPRAGDLVRCKHCGSPGHQGERCKECGRVVVPKET